MFGNKKKRGNIHAQTSNILGRLTSRTAKETVVNEFEKAFFISLERQLQIEGLPVSYFNAERMGSGAIRLNCPAGIIGTVQLLEKIGSIQYFTSFANNYDMTDAPFEAIIAAIPYWIEYAKHCIKQHNKALSI